MSVVFSEKGLIKYEVYYNGIKNFYDTLVKYNDFLKYFN